MDIHGKTFGLWLMLFAILLVVGCTPKAILAPQDEVPANIEEYAQKLIAGLSKEGFEIIRGYPRL